jgi:hypothetical protein
MTFKFWEMLKNASDVILVPKNIFFLTILNFVQSFVECKVSLADGTFMFSFAFPQATFHKVSRERQVPLNRLSFSKETEGLETSVKMNNAFIRFYTG